MGKSTGHTEGSPLSDDSVIAPDSEITEQAPEAQATEIETPAEAEAPALTVTVTDPAIVAAFETKVTEAVAFLESIGFTVRHGRIGSGSAGIPRDTVEKADPDEVRAYFDSTGLTRAEIAAAVGVTTSVISTVQNPKGDRWSQARFERAKPLIASAMEAKALAMLAALAPKAEVTETVEVAV